MPSTLLLGGARSGKSALAVDMGERRAGAGQQVVVIATATTSDDDMADRIAAHRKHRPDWPTIEEPRALDTAIAGVDPAAALVVDCLSLWVSNMLETASEPEIVAHAERAAALAVARTGSTIVVSNEVGLGVHPGNELGRRYRDLLGRVNRIWADASSRSLLLVAGRAVPLIDPWEILS